MSDLFRNASIEFFHQDKTEEKQPYPATLLVDSKTIKLSYVYDEEEGEEIWEGVCIAAGHYRLKLKNGSGVGTLHHFPTTDFADATFEGFWKVSGETGMWLVKPEN